MTHLDDNSIATTLHGSTESLDGLQEGTQPDSSPQAGSENTQANSGYKRRAPEVTGLYGKRGWTRDKRIGQLLQEHATVDAGAYAFNPEINDPLADDFIRFAGLDAVGAKLLWQRVPVANLTDRQNSGPTLLSMLALATRLPERVELGGYMVGSRRVDERISIDSIALIDPDGVEFRENSLCAQEWVGTHTTRNVPTQYFLRLAQGIGLTGWYAPPDEFIAEIDEQGRYRWWIWWD